MKTMIKKRSCAFTGHRPKSFPWKHNETARDCVLLKETLTNEIEKLISQGVTDFYSGAAEGVDIWAAKIVIDLREKNPALNVHCILPYRSQEEKWEPPAQRTYKKILEQSDSVTCLSENYYEGCMLDRNRYLVEHAGILLAVYNGSQRSGTGMTVRYAKKLGRRIIIIDSKTRLVAHFCDQN